MPQVVVWVVVRGGVSDRAHGRVRLHGRDGWWGYGWGWWRWRVVLATPCSCVVQQHRHSGNNEHTSGHSRAKP